MRWISLLVILAMSSTVDAQKKEPPEAAVLEVAGVNLHLGMTKAEVTAKLSGTTITKMTDDNWMIAPKTELDPALQFTNDRLSFADRYWPSQDNDIVEPLIGVVAALNAEGFSACTVTSYTKTTPEVTSHGVWIECGQKSILIQRMSFQAGKSYNTVYEQLGGMHPWTKE
jgi:hypothetical protein